MANLPTGTVTFLFTDVEGSTRRWEADRVAMSAATARLDDLVAHHVEAHHGVVVKPRGEGDSHFCVFGRASDAAQAALDLQAALAGGELSVRVAVHTGEAELREADYYGPTVNRAARLRAIGHGGQILLSNAAADLVRRELPVGTELRAMGTHTLKDLDDPEEVFQVHDGRAGVDFPPLKSAERLLHNIPPARTSFLGRDEQVRDVVKLLENERLITLTGAGGCGKTRLALAVASATSDRWRDGAWVIELAKLYDAGLVPTAVAGVLGILGTGMAKNAPADVAEAHSRLLSNLRELDLALVLDNAEHLAEGVADLADEILASCPDVTIVVTSREPLGVAGEVTYRVPPLEVPGLATDGGPHTAAAIAESESVRLFVDRAARVRSGFALDDINAPAVAAICRALDGIPLAIELAAARMGSLSPGEVADRLDDMLGLLSQGRGRTLEAAIAWSHDLLDETEQVVFSRLSVFAGSFSLRAAESVVATGALERRQVVDAVARLVDRSLIEVMADPDRYRMLEPIRQFAAARLEESGLETATKDALLEWAVTEADAIFGWGNDGLMRPMLRRGDEESGNLRAAFEVARARGGNELLRLARGCFWYWTMAGHSDAISWVEEGLAAPGCDDGELRGEALGLLTWGHTGEAGNRALDLLAEVREAAAALGVGDAWWLEVSLATVGMHLLENHQDLEGARSLLREASDVHRRDHPVICHWITSYGLAYLAAGDGDLEGAWRHADEGDAALPEEEGEMLAVGQFQRGRISLRLGDPERAHHALTRAAAGYRELGNPQFTAWVLNHLASAALTLGHHAEAREHAEESVGLGRRVGNWATVVESLHTLGQVLRFQGDDAGARRALEEGYELSRTRGGDDYSYTPQYLTDLAALDADAGDLVIAARRVGEALRLAAAPHPGFIPRCLRRLAYVVAGLEGPRQAATLLGAWEAHRPALNLPTDERKQHDAVFAALKSALGDDLEAALEEGRGLSVEAAVATANRFIDEITSAPGPDDSVDEAEA